MSSQAGPSGSDDTSSRVTERARVEMRQLHQAVLNSKAEYTSTSSDKLGKALDTANEHFQVLHRDARGAAIDASFLSTASMLGAEQAGNLEKVTPEVFVRKLLAGKFGFANHTKVNWMALSQEVAEAGIYTPVPAPTFLLGKFTPPERKQRQERKRKETTSDQPQRVAEQKSISELQETAEEKAQVVRVKTLQKTIAKLESEAGAAGRPRRVNLFQLLLHPTSYSQTIENFFDLAFLIKDGDAQLIQEPDCMYAASAKRPKTDDYKGGVQRTQNILKLDFTTYQALVRKWLKTSPPLLPSREGGAAAEGGARPTNGKQPRVG